MKILVPIDGSSYSENSLSFVASRTSLLGQTPEIELLVVLDPLPARPHAWSVRIRSHATTKKKRKRSLNRLASSWPTSTSR